MSIKKSIDPFDYIGCSPDKWKEVIMEYLGQEHEGAKQIHEEFEREIEFDFTDDGQEELTPNKTPTVEDVSDGDNDFGIEVMDWILNED